MTEPRSTGPDGDAPDDDHLGPDAPEPEPTPPAGGPPAAGIFSLERPASGLYLVAWLLTGIGLATLIVAVISTAGARSQLAMAGLAAMSIGLAAACGSQVVERRVSRPASAYRGPSPVLGFFTAAVLSGTAAVVLGIAGLLDPAAGSGFL
ncbi:MAG TPA: hypothetical protein VMT36_09425, partial [Candidatus Saccharimonadia bacterium]|nr:hypothetical protein [Candidatus Saccharimonadia bacterium]